MTTTPRQLQSLYAQGVNISAHLRQEQGLAHNTREIVEVAYDLQTGSYVQAMENPDTVAFKCEYNAAISRVVLDLCRPESILEAGVGEATTLSGVLQHLPGSVRSFGFDLSWSRVACARQWLESQDLTGTTLCTGDLYHIPLADNAVDVVFTSHAVEPNGGGEEAILRELYRVARRYLVLLEPGFELASAEARSRMASHGYCRNLAEVAQGLGGTVLTHELFSMSVNPLNPTALTVVCKGGENSEKPRDGQILACPRYKTPLQDLGGCLFSPEALTVYPVIGGIPCLRIENGIVAGRYPEYAG